MGETGEVNGNRRGDGRGKKMKVEKRIEKSAVFKRGNTSCQYKLLKKTNCGQTEFDRRRRRSNICDITSPALCPLSLV